tara:strand:- start:503 stop:745 length:243 start_codon:yes stop_codon:yes gene_type:complete
LLHHHHHRLYYHQEIRFHQQNLDLDLFQEYYQQLQLLKVYLNLNLHHLNHQRLLYYYNLHRLHHLLMLCLKKLKQFLDYL